MLNFSKNNFTNVLNLSLKKGHNRKTFWTDDSWSKFKSLRSYDWNIWKSPKYTHWRKWLHGGWQWVGVLIRLDTIQKILCGFGMKPHGNNIFFTKPCHRQMYQIFKYVPPQRKQISDFQSHFSVLTISGIFMFFL